MNAAAWLPTLPPTDRWRSVLLARAPQIATWVLALAIAVQAAIMVTNLAGVDGESGLDGPAAPPPAARQRVDVAAIANSHLFGEPRADPSSAEDAPQTNMPLVLTGIIAADDPQNGLAIVGESAVAARVRAVGDSLPGGARLHAVYSDRVLLDRGGRLEALVLPRQSTGGAGATPSARPPPVAAVRSENPAVERMRQLITEEPGVISDIMRQQPVFAQGKQRGYRVYPGRNRQAFMRLGLRPGDLVTAINGTPLDDPARGAEIFRTIGSSSEARVTVMRNGRAQELTLNMAQIASEADQLIGAPGVAPVEQPAPVSPESPMDE
ncbi:MAG: type II secretion system protein GspC [Steroidobacteraceae bacterium]